MGCHWGGGCLVRRGERSPGLREGWSGHRGGRGRGCAWLRPLLGTVLPGIFMWGGEGGGAGRGLAKKKRLKNPNSTSGKRGQREAERQPTSVLCPAPSVGPGSRGSAQPPPPQPERQASPSRQTQAPGSGQMPTGGPEQASAFSPAPWEDNSPTGHVKAQAGASKSSARCRSALVSGRARGG